MKLTAKDVLHIAHCSALDFDRRGLSISGVSTDSRALRAGELFIAIRGEKYNGHDFITGAVQAGASVVVVEKRWADTNAALLASLPIPRLVVEEGVRALGELARTYRRKFSLPLIAIGGSNGKTTTKEMIRETLAKKYRVMATEGNHNNHIGVPQTLFRLTGRHSAAVVEMGSNHPGEVRSLCEIAEPTHALLTNVGKEHLEFFRTARGAAKAEGEMFQWLREHGGKSGVAFLNNDDSLVREQAKGITRVVSYGMAARGVHVRGAVKKYDAKGCALLEIKPKGKKGFVIPLSIPGRHHAMNALAAATVGLTFKVPPRGITEALRSFEGSNKRMEVLRISGVTVINDTYNSNPDSVLAAFETLKSMHVEGKRIAVLSDMLEMGKASESEHARIGRIAKRYGIDYLLTYGPLSRWTHEAARSRWSFHYEQKNVMAEYLAELISDGDVVLVKGSRGMRMEDVVTFIRERLAKVS